jgi:hypothetical protein
VRWLVVGLSVLALILVGIVVWIADRFARTGAELLIMWLLLAALLGIGLAVSGWRGWQLIQGIALAMLILVGLLFVIFVMGSSLPGPV